MIFGKRKEVFVMSGVFGASSSAMLTMFFCIVVGFILKKSGVMPDHTAKALSKLENYVLVPALILNTFMENCTVENIRKEYVYVLYSGGLFLLSLGLAVVISKLLAPKKEEEYLRSIFQYGLVFGNFGYLGNAIVPAIMGQEALFHYMLFCLPLHIGVYSWGYTVLTPREAGKTAVWRRFLNPVILSCVAGIALGLLGVKPFLPAFVTDSVSNLAACMGPIAMVLTGYTVGSYVFKTLLTDWRVYLLTALRLLVLPALFIGVMLLLGTQPNVLFYTLFAFATPLGMNTVVFPAAHGKDTKPGASMTMISHVLSVITIPAFYAVLTALLAA